MIQSDTSITNEPNILLIPHTVLRQEVFGRLDTKVVFLCRQVCKEWLQQADMALMEQSKARKIQPSVIADLCSQISCSKYLYFENFTRFNSFIQSMLQDLDHMKERKQDLTFRLPIRNCSRDLGVQLLSSLESLQENHPPEPPNLELFCDSFDQIDPTLRLDALRNLVFMLRAIRLSELTCGLGEGAGLLDKSIFDREVKTVRLEREIVTVAKETMDALLLCAEIFDTEILPPPLSELLSESILRCSDLTDRLIKSDQPQPKTLSDFCRKIQRQIGRKAFERVNATVKEFHHDSNLSAKKKVWGPLIRRVTYVGEVVFVLPTFIGALCTKQYKSFSSRHWFWSAPHRGLAHIRGHLNSQWDWKYNPTEEEIADFNNLHKELERSFGNNHEFHPSDQ